MSDIEMQYNELEVRIAMVNGRACDNYDYLIATFCGMVGGLIDVMFVGSPVDSKLLHLTDAAADEMVKKFAKYFAGWSPREGNENNVASAIGCLERKLSVNYDHRTTNDTNGQVRLNTKNHHIKSLSHAPDPIGLFFSIMDQFQDKASYIDDGHIIRIDTNNEDSPLRGTTFQSKLFCGFCNWIGHIMSDLAGSSGNRAKGGGRGSGVPIPFMELFLLLDFGSFQVGKDRQTFAVVMTRVFQSGYDFRFGMAMAIPVILTDLMIKVIWVVRNHFERHVEWNKCNPDKTHPDLRTMCIIGNGTLCLVDGADAFAKSGGNFLQLFLHLNLIAWYQLAKRTIDEIAIRYNFSYKDLVLQYEYLNQQLDSYIKRLGKIDYEKLNKELETANEILSLLKENEEQASEKMSKFIKEYNSSASTVSYDVFNKTLEDKNSTFRF